MKDVIKNLKGNLLLISNDQNLIEQAKKNKNIDESYILSNSGKGKSKLKLGNKKIHINKIKRYFNKKSVDNLIVDYKLVKNYMTNFVKNSVYLNKGNLYFYNIDKENEIEKKYQRYNAKIEINKNYLKIDNQETKSNIFKDNYYILKDKIENILDKLSDILTS